MRLRIAFPLSVLLGFLAACGMGGGKPSDVEGQHLGHTSQAMQEIGEACWSLPCYAGLHCVSGTCLPACSTHEDCKTKGNATQDFHACAEGFCRETPRNNVPLSCEPACWAPEICKEGSCQAPPEEEEEDCTPGWDCEEADP